MIVLLLSVGCRSDRPYVRIFTPIEQQSYRSGDPIDVFGVIAGSPADDLRSSLTISYDGVEVPASEIRFWDCSDTGSGCNSRSQSFAVALTAGDTDGWIRAKFRGTNGHEDVDVVSFRSDGSGSGLP